MRVGPLNERDVAGWLRLEGAAGPAAERWLTEERRADPEPWSWLVVHQRDELVGRARVHRAGRTRRVADLVVAAGVDGERVAAAVLDVCERRFGTVEVAAWAGSEALGTVALRRGYAPWVERVYVERALRDLPPVQLPWRWRSLSDRGALERAAIGNPGRDVVAGPHLFAQLRDWEGPDHDPGLWCTARLGGRVVGVVLMQRMAGAGAFGTLTFIGVVPEARGRGLGRDLHRAALARLAAAGCRRYVCATDRSNTPMLRTYAANGCVPIGLERQYRLSRPTPSWR